MKNVNELCATNLEIWYSNISHIYFSERDCKVQPQSCDRSSYLRWRHVM